MPTDPRNDSGRWNYVGPDGAEHFFYPTLHEGEAAVAGRQYTRDGSYLRLRDVAAGQKTVEFPDGRTHLFTFLGGQTGFDWLLTRISDPYGNALNVSYGASSWQLTDNWGRSHTVSFTTVPQYGQVVSSVVLAAFNGTTAAYTFAYTNAAISRACPDNDPQTGNVTLPFLTAVTLPDGSQYQMPLADYDTAVPAGLACSPWIGRLRRMTLPTKGQLEWTYQSYPMISQNAATLCGQFKPQAWLERSVGVATRTVRHGAVAGTWTYGVGIEPSIPLDSFGTCHQPGRERQTAVTSPLGDQTVHYFSTAGVARDGWRPEEYGLPLTHNQADATGTRFLSSQVFDLNEATGQQELKRSTYVRYEMDQLPAIPQGDDRWHYNRRVAAQRTVYHDDGGRVADEDRSQFDGLGHYRQTVTGGTFGAGDVRTTVVQWNPTAGEYRADGSTVFNLPAASAPWLLETYAYDVGNRLKQVSTTAAGVTQVRSFTYDNRGFLASESHPEKGAAVAYSNYDARGHAGRRIDGPNDLTFTFDRAERLTQVRETGGLQRPLKTFGYAAANGSGDWKNGKLEQQSRFNYITVNGGPFKVEIRERFAYGGRGGRVSTRILENWVNDPAAPNEAFSQTFSFDPLGNVRTLGYPQCTHAGCTAPAPRAVQFNYTEGLLSSVTGYAGSITYHPNLLVHQVTHANNVIDTQANDPNGMRRPASIQAATSTGTVRWSTGGYTYDGSANITRIGPAWFTYDRVSRLTAGAVNDGPTGAGVQRQQSYAFDPFGNINSITTGATLRNTPTSSATNRLTGGVYDTAGNLTSWNGSTYTYGPFNQVWSYRTATDEWVYLYGADDERAWIYKTDGTDSRWFLRDLGGRVLREYGTNGGWRVDADYIYRDGLLLAAETPAGVRHFHLDHLGTPRLVTDGLGQQKAYHVYYPFGEEATAFNQDTLRLKFTGHERDLGNPGGAGDDLNYMHARHCSPLTGRFLSVDPGTAQLRLPQSWNRYAYALGNPIKYVDPDGKVVDVVIDLGFIGYDLFDIGRSLVRGEGVSRTQWLALTADAGATLVPLATGAGLAVRLASRADDAVDVANLANRFARVEGRAEVLRKVIRTDGRLNVSDTVGKQLAGVARNKDRSFIPVQSILDTIGSGTRSADPQRVANQFMYTSEAVYNGSKGVLEVLVNEEKGQIVHVLFRSAK